MVSPVPPSQYSRLLPFFPDIPENVHIRYFLTKERCEVYLVGDISNPHAAIIRPKFEILMSLQNWSSILIDNNISNQLASPLKLQDINFIKEIYLILDKPISTQDVNNARLLTAGDLRLLKDGPKQFYEAGLRDSREILSHGIAAGVIVNNRLVATAHATHITEKCADVGIFTLYESPGQKPHSCLEYRQKQPSITKGCPKNRVYPNIYKNLHLHTK